ncbi:MAG: thioredoxin [Candidatus Aenigmarchaeota archaeon]|nr:thioredoxin [Candidatus Aenigmarchaeota archaeon]
MENTVDATFSKDTGTGLVLVDFSADWCGPCHALHPLLLELEKEMKKVKFLELDVDSNPVIAQQFMVMSIPTLVLFQNGKQVSRLIGLRGKAELKSWIETYL